MNTVMQLRDGLSCNDHCHGSVVMYLDGLITNTLLMCITTHSVGLLYIISTC